MCQVLAGEKRPTKSLLSREPPKLQLYPEGFGGGGGGGGAEPEPQKGDKVFSKNLAPLGVIAYICLSDCGSPS